MTPTTYQTRSKSQIPTNNPSDSNDNSDGKMEAKESNENKRDNKQSSNNTSCNCEQDGAAHFAVPAIQPSNRDQDPETWLLYSGLTVHVTNSYMEVTSWTKAHETIIVGSGKELEATIRTQ